MYNNNHPFHPNKFKSITLYTNFTQQLIQLGQNWNQDDLEEEELNNHIPIDENCDWGKILLKGKNVS